MARSEARLGGTGVTDARSAGTQEAEPVIPRPGGRREKQAVTVEDGGACTGSAAIPPLVPAGCSPQGTDSMTTSKKKKV